MAHYAKVESGIVTEVIVAEQDYIDTLSGTWVQTSYNSNIRKNFAGKGYTYDSQGCFYCTNLLILGHLMNQLVSGKHLYLFLQTKKFMNGMNLQLTGKKYRSNEWQ